MTDETVRPTIVRPCLVCGVTDEDVAAGIVIVSPTGLAHHGCEYGVTGCGRDATGDGWWWPL